MSRSDTRSKIPSNINQSQTNEFFKMKIGQLNFNNNGIAIIHKQESSQEIIPLFFGIKQNNNESYDTLKEKPIIFKFPFVLFKPIDSIDIYKIKCLYFIILQFISHMVIVAFRKLMTQKMIGRVCLYKIIFVYCY